jgi:hypothetical protein
VRKFQYNDRTAPYELHGIRSAKMLLRSDLITLKYTMKARDLSERILSETW